jgi:glycosyltransferase EpsD
MEERKINKKVLITANTDRHILLCHMPYIKWFNKNKWDVYVATNTDKEIVGAKKINLNMTRNPFSIKNCKAVWKLTKNLKQNKYKLIHTHTPVGSVVTRLAHKFSRTNAKLIYTCHGFHFYKGCPFYYWMIFYPIERYLMKYTDLLLVMNKEDYNFTKKHFKNVKVKYINGVGFNKERISEKTAQAEIENTYKKYGLNKEDFIVIYIAEYSKRKRQIQLIEELAKTDIKNQNIKILLIGDDILNGEVQREIEKRGLENAIKTIEFTDQINKFLDIANVVISASRQEGLPLNILEAIYKKKIIIATDCRGNRDLICEGKNGFLVNDLTEIYDKIKYVKSNYNNLQECYNPGIDIEDYTSTSVVEKMAKIYNEVLEKS